MKSILFLSFTTMIISSCAKYYIAEVSSTNVSKSSNSLIYENDTIKITYKFWANKGVMSFDIYNKTGLPLYFDWKKSAYIPNDKMLSYWQDEVNMEGIAFSNSYYTYTGIASKSKIKTKSVRQERVGVVPPHSLINSAKYILYPIGKLENNKEFSFESSPLKFRNYLAISTNEDFNKEVWFIDNSFYISKSYSIKQTKINTVISNSSFYISSN